MGGSQWRRFLLLLLLLLLLLEKLLLHGVAGQLVHLCHYSCLLILKLLQTCQICKEKSMDSQSCKAHRMTTCMQAACQVPAPQQGIHNRCRRMTCAVAHTAGAQWQRCCAREAMPGLRH